MTWRLRVWFEDASQSRSFTGTWLREPNEAAIFAFVNAIRALSNAQITKVDIYRLFSYQRGTPFGLDQSVGMFVQPGFNTSTPPGLVDAFPMWVRQGSEGAVNDLWGYTVTARDFMTQSGATLRPPVPSDGEPQTLDNQYPDATDDYYLVAIRRNFWHRLLRDARSLNTYSMALTRTQARRVRLDLLDLFRGVPMTEVLERLDRIIQLLQQDAEVDQVEELLAQLIAIIGAP